LHSTFATDIRLGATAVHQQYGLRFWFAVANDFSQFVPEFLVARRDGGLRDELKKITYLKNGAQDFVE
jgi:hypothetical protein